MADNFHDYNDEEEEQDKILADLTALTTQVNNIDLTTINNKLAGTASSGLKTLIEGNDTDIQNIQTKTDFISVSQNVDLDEIETHTNLNNAKNSYPSGDAVKVGRITIDGNLNLTNMNNSITTNTNAIDAIELKTDHISVSQSVDLDSMESQIATNQTNISNNTGSILAHTTAINNKLAGTTSSGLKTLIDVNTAKTSFPGFGTSATTALAGDTTTISASQANQITANTLKVGITSSQSNQIVANQTAISDNDDDITAIGNMLAGTASSGLKTLIDANTAKNSYPSADATKVGHITITGAVDLDAVKTELDNVVITTTNLSNTRILMGSAPSFTGGCGIQNPEVDATMVNTKVMIRQDNQGRTFLNCVTGKTISFRVNNVEQFDSDEVKALTDNISVTQAVDLDSMESSISLNNSLIYTNLNTLNNTALPPLKIHCLAHRVSHVGSTAMAGASDLVNMTNAFQAIRWENVVGSTHGGGITWSTINSSTNTYFQIPETALYRVSATIICMFTSSGNERQASLELAHYNNSSGTITSIRQTHSSMNRQDGNNFSFSNISMDTPTLLEEDEYYFFRCKSENQGNIAIHSSSATANSVIITKIQTDSAGNTFGTGGSTSYNFDGHRTFVGV